MLLLFFLSFDQQQNRYEEKRYTQCLCKTGCLTSTETIRLIRDGEKAGRGYGEVDYILIATLSPPQ